MSEFQRAIAKVEDCLSLVMSSLTQECDMAEKLKVMSEFFGLSTPCECLLLETGNRMLSFQMLTRFELVSDIAIFVLKRDVKLQLTNTL